MIKKFIDSQKYYFSDTLFKLSMRKRINNVLLICSTYDAFILEQDGRIDEQIFNEYTALNLRYPPQFFHASSETEAYKLLDELKIDLVITMYPLTDKKSVELIKKIKAQFPKTPIVLLSPYSRDISINNNDTEVLPEIDFEFHWLGNANILLAIIKLIEDQMNVEHDVFEVGLQVILLVEDSVQFYSSYLPLIYKIIFQQSLEFMTEGLNDHQRMLRLRGRPKILLARNYEEAITYYEKYKNNLLGIISDIRYKRNNKIDNEAGITFCKKVKSDNQFVPFFFQSSDLKYETIAKELNVGFINKNSKNLLIELREYIKEYFAFGDFVFRDPNTLKEIGRATDLQSLQNKIFQIPDDSFRYHVNRNDFSKWLNARALFPIAEIFKYLTIDDFEDLDSLRRYLYDTISNFRLNKVRGVIANFNRFTFDEYFNLSRIGESSIGGKARGLAFIDSLIKRNRIFDKYDDILITIPRTIVISTDIFDEFMELNKLYKVALSDLPDEEILQHFIKARLPVRIHQDMLAFTSVVRNPIAIRSSSLLEDSHYQPFAGVYNTFMIPHSPDENTMVEQLGNAIKSVYASVYYKSSKTYMRATSNLINEEKMAIILQEICGQRYGNYFYPTISGVARSVNYYPIGNEKSSDGIASLALGLGRYIVNGGVTIQFSPKHPNKILQLSSPDMALRETQKYFYALDLNIYNFKPSTDDGINIQKLKIDDASPSVLKYVASTYDFENNLIRDGINYNGKKIITFSSILNHSLIPLAEILQTLLSIGEKEINNPVEIEFAINLNTPKGYPKVFNFLQIRPIVENNEIRDINIADINPETILIASNNALGNGVVNTIYDIVYIKPETFNSLHSTQIATQLENINQTLVKEERQYILIGPGRWGSSDSNLGIPVKWQQISNAKLIVEAGISNYRIDPSQGTHFFHNLTALRIGYFTINPYINDGSYDIDFLSKHPPVFENEFVRHIRFKNPLTIKIDGRSGKGIILKPS